MRLITLQDIFVKRQIEFKRQKGEHPMYTCDRIFFERRDQNLYNKYIDKMREKIDYPKDRVLIPIWCWVVRKDDELSDELIFELVRRYNPKCQFPTAYELEVPNDAVLISNYEVWSKLLFNNMMGVSNTDEDFNKLFEKQKGAVLQATIPFIHSDFIKSFKQMNSFIDRDYSKTEYEIEKLMKSGNMNLSDDGYIESMSTDDR